MHAEYGLTRLALKGRTPLSADPLSEPGVVAKSDDRVHKRLGVRCTSRESRPSTSISRAAGVSAVISGVPTARAWKVLCGITRWAFPLSPKMPSEHPAPRVLVGNTLVFDPGNVLDVRRPRIEQLRHLTGADDSERDVGQPACGPEYQIEAMQRRGLANEQDVEVLCPMPGLPK